jgi:fatty acid desaturase
MTYAPPAQLDVGIPEPARAVGDESLSSLLREVREAGLLRPRHRYYIVKIAINLAMFGAVWAAFVIIGNSWWQLVVAVLLAFCYTQTGFIGHDIGHRQIAHNKRWAEILGFFHGNLLLGFSYSWWVSHHNKHHGYPNHLERDSDITRRRVIFIPEQGHLRQGRPKQFIVRHQHVVFFPLLLTEGIGLRVASFKAIRDRQVRRPRIEGALILAHMVVYLGALFAVLSPAKAIVFLLIQQLLFGLYIGSVFAPNHKGMPIQRPDEEWDWLTRQVVTSRNIRSSYLIDFLYGGLNYQIEHHLFPGMPRKNLRHARPIAKQYCEAVGLPYHEVSVVQSYAEVVGHLRRTTRTYQQQVKASLSS